MRILIVKTSSMGDVIHTLPALTELFNNNPSYKIDWVVEESFTDILEFNNAINKIIPIAIRRWRKSIFTNSKRQNTILEIKQFYKKLRSEKYDYIIDPQGLLKSAVICKLAKKNKSKISSDHKVAHGLDKDSSRGKYISWAYDKTYSIDNNLHAIYRIKLLFSKVFDDFNKAHSNSKINNLPMLNRKVRDKFNARLSTGYSSSLDYGFNLDYKNIEQDTNKYLVFLHCTTWQSKKWPTTYWQSLINLAISNGYSVKLNSGNSKELEQARQIANEFDSTKVMVMPPQSIKNLINIIAGSKGVVCVDTGLGHLAAALNKPGVGIYGSTNPRLTSILSDKFTNLASGYNCSPCLLRDCNKLDNLSYPPCYQELTPEYIWQSLIKMLLV